MCMTVKFTSSEAMAKQEPQEVCPNFQECDHYVDISITFDHMLDEDAWCTNLKMLGIDIIVVLQLQTLTPPSHRLLISKNYFCARGKTRNRYFVAVKRRTQKEGFLLWRWDHWSHRTGLLGLGPNHHHTIHNKTVATEYIGETQRHYFGQGSSKHCHGVYLSWLTH